MKGELYPHSLTLHAVKLLTIHFIYFAQVDLLEDDSETYSPHNVLMLDDTPMKFPDDDEDQSVCGPAEEKSDVRDLDVDVPRTSPTSADMPEPTVVAGFGLSEGGGIAKLSTSAVTGIGLAALLETLDKRLAHVGNKQANDPTNEA